MTSAAVFIEANLTAHWAHKHHGGFKAFKNRLKQLEHPFRLRMPCERVGRASSSSSAASVVQISVRSIKEDLES